MDLLTVPIGQIEANTWNPNRQTPIQFEALKESLRKFPAVLDGQRIIVWQPAPDGPYQILNGEHRWRACQDLISEGFDEFTEMPVGVVTNIDESTAKLISLTLGNVGEESFDKKARVIISIKDEIDLNDIANTIGVDDQFMDLVSHIDQPSFQDLLDRAEDPYGIDEMLTSLEEETLLDQAGFNQVVTCDIPKAVQIEITGGVRRIIEYAQHEDMDVVEVIQAACMAYYKSKVGDDDDDE